MKYNKSLSKYIQSFYPEFTEQDLLKGLNCFEFKHYHKNDCILSKGQVCDFIFFAESSITKSFYTDDNGDEKVIWIEPEKLFLTDFESFTQGIPSNYNITFYQDTDVWFVSREKLQNLYKSNIHWALFGINILEYFQNRLTWLFMHLFHSNATENYHFIEDYFIELLQVVPLKDVASMLNLSPVTISRIRAKKQLKSS